MISLTQALVARRAMMAGTALAATLGAHTAASGGLHLEATAPLAWGWLLAVAALCGPRRAPWRRRGVRGLLVLLIAWQAALHLAMTAAPWAFGVAAHHRADLVTPTALAAHLGAALVLALLLARAERLLGAALGVATAIRRLLDRPVPRRRPVLLAPPPGARRHSSPPLRPRGGRGPPAHVTA